MRPSYDYIIVGAGSSGCVLANRLSEDPRNSVLLLEAGPSDKHMLITMPMGLAKLFVPGSPYINFYQASPGGNRPPEHWMKGRTLGGSSSINGMVYMRGIPEDYNDWAANGCPGWGWDEIRRCFMAIERHEHGAAEGRGGDGPLYVGVAPARDRVSQATIEAARQMGVPIVDDVNAPSVAHDGGFGLQTRNIKRGRRVSAATAFLRPIRHRKNLDIVTDAEVLGVALDGRRATGVRLKHDGAESLIIANREVLLSAGGIHSPCLLQRSGIGPAALLQGLGIEPVLDVAQVGRNLADHRVLTMQYRIRRGGNNLGLRHPRLALSVLDYFVRGKGPLAQSSFVAGGLVKTDPTLDKPDIQIGLAPFTSGRGGVSPYPAITLFGYTLRPESRGELAITSRDNATPPRIDANYMATRYDRENAVALLRYIRRMAAQPALASLITEEMIPGSAVQDDAALLEATFTYGNTGYHPSGTCRMGSDDDAVVDPRLRVRGIEGLRVIDTSIMPTLVSGNTSGPAMAIAWRAAELILADRQ
ncbi:GMC family oxidoreductase N-terminal domain-containing protein [uncultured Sphingomonas sp.]|uniref:GMC family oxidoreductase n=1 Tax=uncultured Sphingomonas sp. TaxID=158754 RepID=UPI00261CE841|nr:GMC family oxidoreductase N-terminal domain-containing protein [uncultured Sphingomonas sp.]